MIVPNMGILIKNMKIINRCVFKNIDDIVIFACQLWPKHDFNADLYLLQRDKKNINMTMNGGQIRFYILRIYCRTLGILWYK